MKKIFFFPVLLLIPFFSCTGDGTHVKLTGPDTLHIIKEFKGFYRNDGTNRTFVSCDDPGRIHLIENSTHQIDTLYKSVLPNAYPGEAVYMELRAEINPSPDPNFSDLLIAKEFLKVEQKNDRNTCIPYEYYCVGMQPFWGVLISEKEDLIDYYDPVEKKTTHFKYNKPLIKDGITTYVSMDERSNQKISIVIKKEGCSGAIAILYQYSAFVSVNGKALSGGCAVKPENIYQ